MYTYTHYKNTKPETIINKQKIGRVRTCPNKAY